MIAYFPAIYPDELVYSWLCRYYVHSGFFSSKAYIHSLKDKEHDRHVLGDAEIIQCIDDNRYLAEVNGVHCTAIFNFFTGAYYVDDVYGIVDARKYIAGGRTYEP